MYWYWKKFFDNNDILQIDSFIEKNYDLIEDKNNGATDLKGNIKKNIVCKNIVLGKLIKFHKIKAILDCAYAANNRNYGYILYPYNEQDFFLHNTYSSKNLGKYDWHIDESRSAVYDLKFTLLINFSTQKYEGGQFHLFENDEKVVEEFSNPGDVLMFKSHINHKVSPVTKGVRKSLTYFIEGPKFR